jgi:hypothetical protein
MRAWSLLAFALLLPGCLADYGLAYDELHVSATREGETTPVTTTPQNGCTTLPLLLGSQVEKSIGIAGQIDVDVVATRDRVRVSFDRVVFDEKRTILAEDLRTDFVDTITLQSTNGETFVVRLSGDCPAIADPPN